VSVDIVEDRRDLVYFKEVSGELIAMDQAIRWLETAGLKQIAKFRDDAETVRIYAERGGKGLKLQNQAAELKLRAERKAGQILTQLGLRGGNRKSKLHDVTLNLDKRDARQLTEACREGYNHERRPNGFAHRTQAAPAASCAASVGRTASLD
jgi:hypothetical protein